MSGPCRQSPVLTPAANLLLQPPRLKNHSLILGFTRPSLPYQTAASPVCRFISPAIRPRSICVPHPSTRTTAELYPNNGRSGNLHTHVEDHQVRHKHHRVELQWLPLRATSVHLRMRKMQGAVLPSLHIQAPGVDGFRCVRCCKIDRQPEPSASDS
ncbi:hypothetical protein DPSP01_013220 [Paraphaeosphaeria sporulosa]